MKFLTQDKDLFLNGDALFRFGRILFHVFKDTLPIEHFWARFTQYAAYCMFVDELVENDIGKRISAIGNVSFFCNVFIFFPASLS